MHPGAKDAVDILGDLLNAASRAPLPRHELEEYVREHYDGKPTWAGGKQHKKTAQGAPKAPRGPPPATQGPETSGETSAGRSIPAPAPIVEDVQMEDSLESRHQQPAEEMALEPELVGNNAPEATTTWFCRSSPVTMLPIDLRAGVWTGVEPCIRRSTSRLQTPDSMTAWILSFEPSER